MIEEKFSDKLQAYIAYVEKETSHTLQLKVNTNININGMTAQIHFHPKLLLVEYDPKYLRDCDFERTIAHEITHGLLDYAKAYCQIIGNDKISPTQKSIIGLLASLIQDIIVNKTIQENGFDPFGSEYLDMVKRETKAARRNEDFYTQFEDHELRDFIKVFRYILAWGSLKYLDLGESSMKVLKRFVMDFRFCFPKQKITVDQIERSIIQNDIFTSEGYKIVISEIIGLLGLTNLVEIRDDL